MSKVAIVTGASQGIGKATAMQQAAAQGRDAARGVSSCPCPQYFDPETP